MKIKTFLCYTAAVMVVSCNSANKSEVKTSEVAGDEILQEEVIESLPDTCYPSVDNIKYSIDYVSQTDGKLSTLKDLYKHEGSVMTFRVGQKRQGCDNGKLDSIPTELDMAWKVDTELEKADTKLGPWGGGTGWTGQPLYIEWPDSLATLLKNKGLVNENFKGAEIIVGSLCGLVYFINPETGAQTRQPIPVGNTIKGTPSFDPTFNGNLYVGQGTVVERPFGAVVINLYENKVTDVFGEDPKAQRRWGAYDSSSIRAGQFLFRPGENGGVYKLEVSPGSLKLHTVLRYTVNGQAPGIEASMAVYANYGFTGDNHGNVLGINLNTMKPVWHYSTGDDTDATPLLALEDGHPYLYVGCEIDREPRGYAVFAKLDAVNGREIWKIKPEGVRRDVQKKHFDGGFYASPLLGSGDCEGLIFTNMVKNTNGANGCFMAIDRKDGKVVYEIPLKCYSWSSPVAFLTPREKMIVVTADGAGNIYIIDGKKGEIITSKKIGHNFESSPCIVGNAVVVGSRGNGIFKVNLK